MQIKIEHNYNPTDSIACPWCKNGVAWAVGSIGNHTWCQCADCGMETSINLEGEIIP